MPLNCPIVFDTRQYVCSITWLINVQRLWVAVCWSLNFQLYLRNHIRMIRNFESRHSVKNWSTKVHKQFVSTRWFTRARTPRTSKLHLFIFISYHNWWISENNFVWLLSDRYNKGLLLPQKLLERQIREWIILPSWSDWNAHHLDEMVIFLETSSWEMIEHLPTPVHLNLRMKMITCV